MCLDACVIITFGLESAHGSALCMVKSQSVGSQRFLLSFIPFICIYIAIQVFVLKSIDIDISNFRDCFIIIYLKILTYFQSNKRRQILINRPRFTPTKHRKS
jgi:hypothetical protein